MDPEERVSETEIRLANLSALRNGAAVMRWHTRRVIFPETVGHHSANVANLLYVLKEEIPSKELMWAALTHDTAEAWTGDLPAPFKEANEGIRETMKENEVAYLKQWNVEQVVLSKDDQETLKAADIIDLLMTISGELKMGNHDVKDIFERGMSYFYKLNLPHKVKAQANLIVGMTCESVGYKHEGK